ncbi:Cupin domain-containing protein [Haloactinopolyspora alba]|uniref:Cupin domain-containing protein n=1 Tax=Haloactinopolyspora alba TaxID=648780 RepID=A0A2P8E172_9ACTN|nr:cupin domain-containing protein [Haloactinopolyspora alba]PSL03216.1 Cupin domain-containing protein [Haloactinopolyspora alba]
MISHITTPQRVPVPGGKIIDEYVGRASSGDENVSVARMSAPPGWDEPAQTPRFDEVTLVISGSLMVEHDGGSTEIAAGEAVRTPAGERVRYVAGERGAEYVSVCVPAFEIGLAGREDGPGPAA